MDVFVWNLLYVVTSFCSAFIAYIFYKTVDGKLRKIQIFFYCSLSWGLCLRGLIGYGKSPFNADITSALIIIPLFIAVAGKAWYLWEIYIKE